MEQESFISPIIPAKKGNIEIILRSVWEYQKKDNDVFCLIFLFPFYLDKLVSAEFDRKIMFKKIVKRTGH
jgi:hypothetical protein